MNELTVEGFKNGETNSVYLWIWNNKERSDFVRELLEDLRDLNELGDDLDLEIALADELKEWFEDKAPEEDADDIYIHLMHRAIARIEWDEIARRFITLIEEG